MIFTERTISIKNNMATIDKPVLLYRGDYNVEIRFTILEKDYKYYSRGGSNLIETTDAGYGQLVIQTPNDRAPIFSEVEPTKKGAIVFTITNDMIDEDIEVGQYTFQIRLFDEDQESRATIAEVANGIEIREPIATEDVSDTNEVDAAVVNYAITTTAAVEDAFDSDGNYIETTWASGQRITSAKLNKIEAGITGVNAKAASAINSMPTKTSQLINDSNYVTKTYVDTAVDNIEVPNVDLTGYATEEYVNDAVANAQLGGGDVDLSGYAKTTDIPTNVSQLTNDSGYITSVPDEYVTEAELNSKGYLTEHQSLDGYAKTTDIPTVPTNVSAFTNDANYASETYVTNKIAEASLGDTELTINNCLGIHINDFPRLASETDDSPRIQRAFDSLPSKDTDSDGYYKGLMVYFPSGTYEIATTVTGTNVGIIGDTGTIFKGSGTGFMFDISFDGELGFAHVSSGAQIYQWRNFPIEKCIFDGNGTMNGIKHTAGHNISLRDCIFCDTVDYGYYIASGSKYMLDHVSFRGISTDTSLNKLAIYLGGSDHNLKNIIIANYTKGIDIRSACTFLDQCHMWLNHNDRIANSIMYDINTGKCVITNSYIDTVKIGFNVNTTETLTINNINGYNNPVFSLSGAIYIKMAQQADLFVSGAQINDTSSAKFIDIAQSNAGSNIRLIGIRGDCNNIYETYGAGSGGDTGSIACTGITLNQDTLTIDASVSNTATLTATVTPTDTTDTIIWSVSPSGIATVSKGTVTAKANGECIVTATCGSYSASCTVTVNNVSESVETWDLEWNSTDGQMSASNFTVGDGIGYSTQNYLQGNGASTSGDGQKILLANFTGGNQEFEIEFRSTSTFDAGSYMQLGVKDASGNGLKIYTKSSTELQIKNYTDSYPTYTQGEWTKLKIKQEDGNCTFYVNDVEVASNLSTISDSYNFQGIQLSGTSGLMQIRAVRIKQL